MTMSMTFDEMVVELVLSHVKGLSLNKKIYKQEHN